jgi:hypothetical protein
MLEILLEAAETALCYFSFDRTLYEDTSGSKNRKWWHHLKEQRGHSLATAHISPEFVLCGGGAEVHFTEPGALLWDFASSKATEHPKLQLSSITQVTILAAFIL